MFYYNNKRLLSEGMSLDQIKQGLNADLLRMLNNFKNIVFRNLNHTNIKNFLSNQLKSSTANDDFFNNPENSIVNRAKYEAIKEAYIDYMLVNVIENGQPIVSEIDVNNPTGGLKGKFTEFILRVINSGLFENSIENWSLITEFLKICKVSGSNLYKSKNMFFDNVIIPLMNERVAKGEKLGSVNPETGVRGANFSRPSAVSPLQDKVMKVFDAYGIYNGKNLLQTILEEVVPEKVNQTIETFAGYDIKLIDYCLAQKYWKEFYAPNQPNTTRLFFIGNGDLESIRDEIGYELDEDAAYENWLHLDYEDQERWGEPENYFEYLATENVPEFNKSKSVTDSFPYYFVLRALTYACNIYPFKTPYNISKSNLKSNSPDDIAFWKSLSNDDYLVPQHNPDLKIRRTTDWCTKDDTHLRKYILPDSRDFINGFILCLNDALPYDDPNGALQIGIKEILMHQSDRSQKYLTIDQCINAEDNSANCPSYIYHYINQTHGALMRMSFMVPSSNHKTPEIYDIINQTNQIFNNIKKFKFPNDAKLSNEEKKMYFEKIRNQANNVVAERLLRNYIRCLLS